MMKRIVAVVMAIVLACSAAMALAAGDNMTKIKGTTKTKVRLHKKYPANEVGQGVNPITGLPFDGVYTPIMVVLDGAPEAQPHWGVGQADIIFQVPNAGAASTKLMALFTSEYPEQVGGVRSARSSMVPMVAAFDAAFAYGGEPPLKGKTDTKPTNLMQKWKITTRGLSFNLLGSSFRERIEEYGSGAHNLSAHVKEIHEHLIDKGVSFDMRAFRFTDVPRTDGEAASYIQMLHYSGKPKKLGSQSSLYFTYDEALGGYTLVNAHGEYKDRATDERLVFSNVVVIRTPLKWSGEYFTLSGHLTGSGCMELFQNGRYVRGAWYRADKTSRLVLVGPDGEEIEMQRGKTFIELTTDVTEISYK